MLYYLGMHSRGQQYGRNQKSVQDTENDIEGLCFISHCIVCGQDRFLWGNKSRM